MVNNNDGLNGAFTNILTEDFMRFLDSNSVTTNCVMCGNGISIVSETIKTNALHPQKRINYATLFKHEPVIPTQHSLNYYFMLHCEKCGFNTTFAASTVYNWLATEQLKQGKEGENE